MLKRNFTRFINIVLIISCIVHVILIFYNNSNPAILDIVMKNKNIKDVNMPLSFIFCLRNTNSELENEKYKKAGYLSTYRFFTGTSMYNDSIVGWLGHMENGSTYDSIEGKLYTHTTQKKCLPNMFRNVFKVKTGGVVFENSEKDKD